MEPVMTEHPEQALPAAQTPAKEAAACMPWPIPPPNPGLEVKYTKVSRMRSVSCYPAL